MICRQGRLRSPFAFAVLGPLFFASSWAQAQQLPDTPSSVRRLAEAGARTLALQRLEAAQPKQSDEPSWIEWERLRLDLLALRGRDRELLARAKSYTSVVIAQPASVQLLLQTAAAAQRLGEGAELRRWLASAFGHAGLDSVIAQGVQYRSARLAVIEAYVLEGNGDAAYRSMLRFQQEFSPLRTEEAERFVAGLTALDRYSDAANWLAQLDARSPYAAMLRLRAGLMPVDAAVLQARGQLAKGGDAGSLALLEAAGRQQNNRSVIVEAAELRLGQQASGSGSSTSALSSRLWDAYGEAAQQAANQAQLLVGDDTAWLSHASRILALQPHQGRAMLAQVALKGVTERSRSDAQLQLISSLREGKQSLAALLLFADSGRFSMDALDARVRYELGEVAAELRRSELALSYWRAISPPATLTADQWQLRRAGVMVDAGRYDDASSVVGELLQGSRALGSDARKRLLDIAEDALSRAQYPLTEVILSGLRNRAQGAERSPIGAVLGQLYEAKGEPRQAAEAYLEAAATMPASESDRETLQAREAAARNLIKAGMRDDARGVLEWIARNAKDSIARESAVRALRSM